MVIEIDCAHSGGILKLDAYATTCHVLHALQSARLSVLRFPEVARATDWDRLLRTAIDFADRVTHLLNHPVIGVMDDPTLLQVAATALANDLVTSAFLARRPDLVQSGIKSDVTDLVVLADIVDTLYFCAFASGHDAPDESRKKRKLT